VAIANVKDDIVRYEKGFGERQLHRDNPVDEQTLFGIASITKSFTALALGFLVQDGRLRWDDPIARHMPGFQMTDPYATREMTLRDLLCHRSGLIAHAGNLIGYGSTYSRAEIVERIRHLPLTNGFRNKTAYSNLGYLVAGMVIPAVTGMSWDEFVSTRIFEPLGMAHSNTSCKGWAESTNAASPHQRINGEVAIVDHSDEDNVGPAGSINSCASDMAQWMRLMLGNGVLDGKEIIAPRIIQDVLTPHLPRSLQDYPRDLHPTTHFYHYGLGWNLIDRHGRFIATHDGHVRGMLSSIMLVPEDRLGVVVLTNNDCNGLIESLLYHVTDAYLGAPFKDWNAIYMQDVQNSPEVAGPKQEPASVQAGVSLSRPIEEYAGLYLNDAYGSAQVVLENGQLQIHLCAHPAVIGSLSHTTRDTFLCQWSDAPLGATEIPFIFDSTDKISCFCLTVSKDYDPHEYIFTRATPV
jgi:CubicO group peptidase (beta-lactamase class C family)